MKVKKEEEDQAQRDRLMGSDEERNGVSVAFDATGFGRFNVMMMVACGLCWTALAILTESIPWILKGLKEGFSGDADDADIFFTENRRGMLAGAFSTGAIVGGLPFMVAVERFGRSPTLTVGLWLSIIAFLCSATASSWWHLVGLRFLVGCFSESLDHIPNTYFVEMTPTQYRGRAKPFIHAFWQLGSFWVIIAAKVAGDGDWQAFFLIAGAPIVVLSVGLSIWFYGIESPLYLHASGDYQKAQSALDNISRMNGLKEEDFPQLPAERGSDDGGGKKGKGATNVIQFRDIFHRSMIRPNIGLVLSGGLLSFSYTILMTYFNDFLQQTPLAAHDHFIYSGLPAGALMGPFLAAIIVDRLGRVATFQLGGILSCTVGMLVFVVEDKWAMFAVLFLVNFLTEQQWIAIYTMAAELYPTSVRGAATILLGVVCEIINVGASYSGAFMVAADVRLPIVAAMGACLFSSVTMGIIADFETKGRQLTVTAEDVKASKQY